MCKASVTTPLYFLIPLKLSIVPARRSFLFQQSARYQVQGDDIDAGNGFNPAVSH